MSADQLTFGVEVETFIPASAPFSVYGYHSTSHLDVNDLPSELRDAYRPLQGWSPQRDSSIQPVSRYQPCEFVSPILRGRDGLKSMYNAIRCIKSVVGAKVNASCGVHVHVGFPRDPAALKRLVHLVAAHESALYAASGTPRREQGRWCMGIKNDLTPNIRFSMGRGNWGGHAPITCNEHAANVRYKILNLTNMLSGGSRNTVEFRLFSESTDAKKVLAWVRICLALVEKALDGKKAAKWYSNDKAVVEKGGKGGSGFKAFKLLCYKIGWVRGRSYIGDVRYNPDGTPMIAPSGLIVHEHVTYGEALDNIDGLPSLKDSKQLLKDLARRYDEKVAEMQGRVL